MGKNDIDNKKRESIVTRLCWTLVALVVIFILPIIYNMVKLQIVDQKEWKERAKNGIIVERKIEAKRGTIYSSDEKILVTSVPVYDIYVDFGKEKVTKKNKKTRKMEEVVEYVIPNDSFKKYLPALCDSLTKIFPDKSYEFYYNRLSKYRRDGNRYGLLKKGVSYDEMNRMKHFPLLAKETINKKKKAKTSPKPDFRRGIIVESRDIRVYPYNGMARHTIGFFVGKQNEGTDNEIDLYNGLEGYYNKYLQGQKGWRLVQKLARNVWKPIEKRDQKHIVDGQDIVSTIDARLQELAQSSLKKCLVENQADNGCVVLMEVETGYVRAISNLTFVDSVQGYKEISNIACMDLYDPGSTFKTVTGMVLLENKKCDTSDIVPTGRKGYGKRSIDTIKDSHNDGTTGEMTMKRSFEVSSNVGTSYPVYLNYKNNPKEFRNEVSKVLPFQKLGLDLEVQEPNPQVVEDMSLLDLLCFSFGYSSSFTALQILTFYNAIANNGKMVKPIFCSDIREGSKTITHFDPIVINEKICSDETLSKLHDMLIGVVEHGSAQRSLSKTPYGIAGKTGTSQINYTQRRKESMKYRASFAGYFPAKDPKYSCIVVITNPKKNRVYGGELAAPVFKDLADRVCGTILNVELKIPKKPHQSKPYIKKGYAKSVVEAFNYLGINSNINESYVWVDADQDTNNRVSYHNYKIPNNVVPNCKGMTIKDAIYMLEKMGFKVSFEGRGKVVSQTLQPNQPYKKGDKIHLVLNPVAQALPYRQTQTQPTTNNNENKTTKK